VTCDREKLKKLLHSVTWISEAITPRSKCTNEEKSLCLVRRSRHVEFEVLGDSFTTEIRARNMELRVIPRVD
jgi:hypothetical protein